MKKDKNQEEALWQRMEAAVAREKAQQVSPYLATRVMARLDDNPSPGFVWAQLLRSVAVLLALVFGFLSAHWSSVPQVSDHTALVETYFENKQAGLSLEDSWLYSDLYEAE